MFLAILSDIYTDITKQADIFSLHFSFPDRGDFLKLERSRSKILVT